MNTNPSASLRYFKHSSYADIASANWFDCSISKTIPTPTFKKHDSCADITKPVVKSDTVAIIHPGTSHFRDSKCRNPFFSLEIVERDYLSSSNWQGVVGNCKELFGIPENYMLATY